MTRPSAPASSLSKGHLVGLFVVYLVLLVWIVMWKLDVPWIGRGSIGGDTMIKLVPFVRTREAGASAPVEVLVNLALFVPFGVYLGLLAPARPWRAALVLAGSSLAFEIAQYVLAVGRSDSTDVVANTAGGLVGLCLVALARLGLAARTATVMIRVCSIATALALLAGGLYAASPWRPVHVRDVGLLSRIGTPAGLSDAPLPRSQAR